MLYFLVVVSFLIACGGINCLKCKFYLHYNGCCPLQWCFIVKSSLFKQLSSLKDLLSMDCCVVFCCWLLTVVFNFKLLNFDNGCWFCLFFYRGKTWMSELVCWSSLFCFFRSLLKHSNPSSCFNLFSCYDICEIFNGKISKNSVIYLCFVSTLS